MNIQVETTHFEWNGFHSSIQKHDTPHVDLCCFGRGNICD